MDKKMIGDWIMYYEGQGLSWTGVDITHHSLQIISVHSLPLWTGYGKIISVQSLPLVDKQWQYCEKFTTLKGFVVGIFSWCCFVNKVWPIKGMQCNPICSIIIQLIKQGYSLRAITARTQLSRQPATFYAARLKNAPYSLEALRRFPLKIWLLSYTPQHLKMKSLYPAIPADRNSMDVYPTFSLNLNALVLQAILVLLLAQQSKRLIFSSLSQSHIMFYKLIG